MKRVIFICMGNICRSPAGEGLMKALVADRGLDEKILIDSAGTIDYHAGHPADSRMRAAADQRGYQLESLARQITKDDCTRFDLIIAMDRDNLSYCQQLDPSNQIKMKLLSDFLDSTQPKDVPDPYYGGASGFETVLDMIEAACPNILAELIEE